MLKVADGRGEHQRRLAARNLGKGRRDLGEQRRVVRERVRLQRRSRER
jgi:hypothetical protein